jgi:hypothetical protein
MPTAPMVPGVAYDDCFFIVGIFCSTVLAYVQMGMAT